MKFIDKASNNETDDDSLLSGVNKKIKGKIDKESGKDSLCPSLTLKQRVIGYAVCTILGIYFDFLTK